MLFWLGIAAAAGSVVYLGHRYDRKHGGHAGARTAQRHGSVDAAVNTDTRASRSHGPLG